MIHDLTEPVFVHNCFLVVSKNFLASVFTHWQPERVWGRFSTHVGSGEWSQVRLGNRCLYLMTAMFIDFFLHVVCVYSSVCWSQRTGCWFPPFTQYPCLLISSARSTLGLTILMSLEILNWNWQSPALSSPHLPLLWHAWTCRALLRCHILLTLELLALCFRGFLGYRAILYTPSSPAPSHFIPTYFHDFIS